MMNCSWWQWCGIALASIFSASISVAAVPEIDLAQKPLFSTKSNVHPNLLLALSVEFPTVGAAYRGATYDRNMEYTGYFNPSQCYLYEGGNRNVTDGYFQIYKSASAITHECGGDSFSGNFMNWASSSAIDMLRYALTGGDRIVDTSSTTILQRAVLPENFYASPIYFPRRILIADGDHVSAPSQVTPFAIQKLYVTSCRNRILFSDVIGNHDNCDSPAFDASKNLIQSDKRLGEYLVRVKVCDDADAVDRSDLCLRYGSHYKPVGEIQRHASKMRYGVIGYLLDDAASRYGGVLRAPIKYVGAVKREAPTLDAAPNDQPEWDSTTGIFYPDPDYADNSVSTTGNSGVINYLNKFGRSGVYKTFDPLSEMYYEAIRYLQGKQPTPDASSNIGDSMKEGFPVVQNWVDPIIASCQKNVIVTIADVNTHWDRFVPGNQRVTIGDGGPANDLTRSIEPVVSGKTPELDVSYWTHKVGEMEVDTSGAYGNVSPRTNLADLELQDTGANGHGTYYIAGLAYWANTHDIRLDKPTRVKTFAIDVDEGGNGLIDGNNRVLKPRDSQLYLAAKYGGFNDINGDGNPFITADSDGKSMRSNREWSSRADDAPSNYFLASQPNALIQSIRNIFASISDQSGTMAGVASSSSQVSQTGAYVYQPGFDPATWSGSLKKRKLTLNEQRDNVGIASIIEWDAAEILTGINGKAAQPSPATRHLYTSRLMDDASLQTIEFKWEALSNAQKTMLDTSADDGEPDGLGAARMAYLRGERTQEQGNSRGIFRTRDRVLGDIVNSNALYVAAPSLSMRGAGYQNFLDRYKTRSAVVYVGANDGMLHAFNASDGIELFGYVPAALMPFVGRLTRPDYIHRPYVDGQLAAGEALIGTGWKTVLAVGMGGGAQGLFALDVTNPTDFAGGGGALWEFTDADDSDMGNLSAAPAIAKFKVSAVNGVPQYRYFVVAPSGLNNYRPDSAQHFDPSAPSALFLLALDKPASDKWQVGVNYFKFKTPIRDPNIPNGLSAPALVTGSADEVRYAYAGDLQGNLWRYDFTGSAPWSSAASTEPLFRAVVDDTVQPITERPAVIFAPGGGYVVLFGTGKLVEDADLVASNFGTQSFYAIYDAANAAVVTRNQLAPRTLTANGAIVKMSGTQFSYGLAAGDKRGWYFDFSNAKATGERSITPPLMADGRLFFNTLIPGSDLCSDGGGRSYALDALTGLASANGETGLLSEVGLLGAPQLFDIGSIQTGERNAIGRREVKKKYSVFNFGTGGAKGVAAPMEKEAGEITLPAGRFSWREIVNWLELRTAASGK